MRKHNLKLLGFLGLLGLLGFTTKNYGFFGFFGFFSFFAATAHPDERLRMNTYKAGFYAFVVALIGLSTIITAFSLNVGMALTSLLIAAAYVATLLTFVISFVIAERRGR
ncbi:MAG: DUF3796 domain-containing protein [Nanoarchaeota archaeon]